MNFGQRIKKRRLELNITQDELCNAMSNYYDENTVKRNCISMWESGATKEIESANLFKIAMALDVDPVWLRFGSVENKKIRYHHDCDSCVFLCREGKYDVYRCPKSIFSGKLWRCGNLPMEYTTHDPNNY